MKTIIIAAAHHDIGTTIAHHLHDVGVKDVEVVTQERGISFNEPTPFVIHAPKMYEPHIKMSGKEKRRERRKQNRK